MLSILIKSLFLMIKSTKLGKILQYFTSIQSNEQLDLNNMIEKADNSSIKFELIGNRSIVSFFWDISQ